MPLNPQAVLVMEALASAPRLSTTPLDEGRRSYDSLRSMGFGPAMEIGSIEELRIPGPAGPLVARLYRPPAPGRRGLLLHVHGGGFVAGSIEGYDKESRAFAALGSCSVLAFEYRLAPEHRFPAAVEDTTATLAWVFEHAAELSCDPARIAIGGDSAGANLAAVPPSPPATEVSRSRSSC
jgi:acetyl esterase